MKDLFKEIWAAVSRNKLRTALTGFAVSWGIFLLICLLGAGNGLMNSFMGNMDNFVASSMTIWGGFTSKPYAGYKEGRRIKLDEGDVEIARSAEFSNIIDAVSPAADNVSATVIAGTETASINISGVTPGIVDIEKVQILSGRFLNEIDEMESRKVAVIGSGDAEELGGLKPGAWIRANGIAFLIVGVYQTDESRNDNELYVPYSTVKTIFGTGDKIGSLSIAFHGLDTKEENDAFEKALTERIKSAHGAAPDDRSALWYWNRKSSNLEMTKAEKMISLSLWILGLLTLISGIVGVSNIMLISVKERTREFGIRKAIGARPGAILSLIISEAVAITAVFGYIGMLLGMVACEIMDRTIGQSTVDLGFTQVHMLENPTVSLGTAIAATLVLIIAGTIAGAAPALKASKVKPIEALRAE